MYRSFAVKLRQFVTRRLARAMKRVIPEPMLVAVTAKEWSRKEPATWPLPEFRDRNGLERYEYSLFSQNGEDGILRFLFSKIGFSSRKSLEFGFGALQNNCLRLVLHENFAGVFIDGSEKNVAQFNKAAERLGVSSSRAIHRFLTLENLESTIRESGLSGEIDLLVIDVDGNDYWFWDAIHCLSPRVVVIEYNASLGADLSLTVPYDPSFKRFEKHPSGMYCGASLTALTRLGARKGYSLVGCDSNGVNAFFVRNDLLPSEIEPQTPQTAHRPHRRRVERGFSEKNQLDLIREMPYVEIAE